MPTWMRVALACLALGQLYSAAWGWGPATHAYIAVSVGEQTYPAFTDRNRGDIGYGGMAPDLALAAPRSVQDPLFAATHDEPGYNDVWEVGQPQGEPDRAFAGGWITHNQAWAADYYAHLARPLPGPDPRGYVVQKAALLAPIGNIPEDLAHTYVEVAVDVLIERQHVPAIGQFVTEAAAARADSIPWLLVRSYPDLGAVTLLAAEEAFRAGAISYGTAIALPAPLDLGSLAQGLALYANTNYGVDLSLADSTRLLLRAMALCSLDYWLALQNTIEAIVQGP